MKAAPKRVAAARTTPASLSDPGRRQWSTCTAVTWHPASPASTRRARESAPPETAQVTLVPGAGNRHLPSRRLAVELTGAGEGDQLPHRAGAELAPDPAQAGVDVRAADRQPGGGLAHRRRRRHRVEELALLDRELIGALPRDDRLRRGRRSLAGAVEAGEVGPG